jgi:exosortase
MFNLNNIKIIILAGSRDFGRCPIASRLPTALWPVAGKTVIGRLLVHLSIQGIKHAVICSNGDTSLLRQSIETHDQIELKFLDEQLPLGTAGCIREAADADNNNLLLVLPAGMVSPPDIDALIAAHENGKSDLTVVFNPTSKNPSSDAEVAEIYVCEPAVLQYIPKAGYCDIKESLIPAIVRAGGTVHAATLPKPVGNFQDRAGYLTAIADYLADGKDGQNSLPARRHHGSKDVWLANSANVDPSAQIFGPVVIMDNTSILEKAIIFGPTVVGRNVTIGKNTLVENSVLWDGSSVEENCEVRGCVLDYKVSVPAHSALSEQALPYRPEPMLKNSIRRATKFSSNKVEKWQSFVQQHFDKINEKMPNWLRPYKRDIVRWLAGSIVLIAFLWSYWPGIVDLWSLWQRSDEYSSGLLVPFLAVYILWSRRHTIAKCRIRPCLWGLLAFLGAQGVRLFGLFFMYGSAGRLSIVLSIAALVLLLFGWQLFRKVSTILLFLCLMLPWPNRVQAAVALPLQRWATSSAVFCLEVIGYEVVQEGNVIHMGGATVAVAEACNGLRMVTAFFVISGLVVLLVERTWWEKLTVLVSSLPIALLCNTIRLAITAIAFTVLSGEHWEKIFHDFGGYAMMPLSLAIVVFELWLLTKLTMVPQEKPQEIIVRKSEN